MWSSDHIERLKFHWKKMTPQSRMFAYNASYYGKLYGSKSVEELQYVVKCQIPHLSKWAKTELNQRFGKFAMDGRLDV